MSEQQLAEAAKTAERALVDEWAKEAVAAMLVRIKKVCVMEWQWRIEDLQKGVAS